MRSSPNQHVAIATRADPPLPLPRWRARGQMTEMRADDLRFTRAETVGFLKATLDLTLSERDLDALDARTEGWGAALQLAAMLMRGRQDVSAFVDAFSDSHCYLLNCLVEEVLQQQTSAVRSFLYRTSVLERLNPALCDAVVANQERPAQEMLTALERTNLFLIPWMTSAVGTATITCSATSFRLASTSNSLTSSPFFTTGPPPDPPIFTGLERCPPMPAVERQQAQPAPAPAGQ